MTETNNTRKHHGSGFFWGLLIGALLATLLTTAKGRKILHDLIDLGLEMLEEIIEDRTQGKKVNNSIKVAEKISAEEEMKEAEEDLESEITEVEEPKVVVAEMKVEEKSVVLDEAPDAPAEVKSNGHAHPKKRLFRGIRKAK